MEAWDPQMGAPYQPAAGDPRVAAEYGYEQRLPAEHGYEHGYEQYSSAVDHTGRSRARRQSYRSRSPARGDGGRGGRGHHQEQQPQYECQPIKDIDLGGYDGMLCFDFLTVAMALPLPAITIQRS